MIKKHNPVLNLNPELAVKPLWIPGDVHAHLKFAAVRRGLSLQDYSVALLTAALLKEPKPKKK